MGTTAVIDLPSNSNVLRVWERNEEVKINHSLCHELLHQSQFYKHSSYI